LPKVPRIVPIAVEEDDPEGAFGAKGVGEIVCIPTAPAIANAYYQYDGRRRYSLPLAPLEKQIKTGLKGNRSP